MRYVFSVGFPFRCVGVPVAYSDRRSILLDSSYVARRTLWVVWSLIVGMVRLIDGASELSRDTFCLTAPQGSRPKRTVRNPSPHHRAQQTTVIGSVFQNALGYVLVDDVLSSRKGARECLGGCPARSNADLIHVKQHPC